VCGYLTSVDPWVPNEIPEKSAAAIFQLAVERDVQLLLFRIERRKPP
jgi:hypothetical protein